MFQNLMSSLNKSVLAVIAKKKANFISSPLFEVFSNNTYGYDPGVFTYPTLGRFSTIDIIYTVHSVAQM